MAGHGHVTPNADGTRVRCGGPSLCAVCSIELARKVQEQTESDSTQSGFVDLKGNGPMPIVVSASFATILDELGLGVSYIVNRALPRADD